MLLLTREQFGMALGANCRSCVIAPGRIPFTRPPTWPGKVFRGAHLVCGGRRHLGCEWYLHKKNADQDTCNGRKHLWEVKLAGNPN